MDYKELEGKIENLMTDLELWEDFALKTKEKDEDLTKLKEELSNREKIVEKETIIARERKLVLDAREKNIEAQENRLLKLSQ